jgi:hypothetical protein
VLVRFLAQKYVDQFFEDGSLRLSSFEAFRKHPDERRRDTGEGFVAMDLLTPAGNSIQAMGGTGDEIYVLCASMIDKPPSLPRGQGAICILRPKLFLESVATAVPGYVRSTMGRCEYRSEAVIRKVISREIQPPADDEDPDRWLAKQKQFMGTIAIDGLFQKHESYSHESEFRFMWVAAGESKEYLDLCCPGARSHCIGL